MSSLKTLGEPAASTAPGKEAPAAIEFGSALDALVSNPRIKLTDVQRHLLAYLGRKSLDGSADQLKEYVIGVEAFGKSPQYNPQEDSSVRVQAGRLRQRLDEYFENEGGREPIAIRLQKGCFRVTFERREISLPEPEIQTPARSSWPRLTPQFCLYLAAILLITQSISGYLLWQSSRRPDNEFATTSRQLATPGLEDFWRGFLEPGRTTVVAAGSALFARFELNFVRDARFQNWDDLVKDEKFQRVAKEIGGHPPRPFSDFTGTGELSGVFNLSRYLFSQGKDPTLRFSRTLNWDDFRNHNVILLGSYKTFPHWNEIAPHLNFALQNNVVTNRQPLDGEPAGWTPIWSSQFGYTVKDFAVVTKLTNIDGIQHLLLIEGGSGEASLGACEYLTDPKHAEELERKLDPRRKGSPASFQVVLASTCRAQVPLETTYVTHRVVTGGTL